MRRFEGSVLCVCVRVVCVGVCTCLLVCVCATVVCVLVWCVCVCVGEREREGKRWYAERRRVSTVKRVRESRAFARIGWRSRRSTY